VFKIVVSLASIVALIFWFGAAAFVIDAAIRGVNLPTRYIYFYSFPPVYFSYCIFSCTKLLKPHTLILSGVIIHIALAVWVIAGGTAFVLAVGLFFTLLWSLLCVLRTITER